MINEAYHALREFVGNENISIDPAILWAYSKDSSIQKPKLPDMVIRPNSTQEVSSIIKYANENKIPIIPSGGRSSLCGAGYSLKGGGIIIDLTRMTDILIYDDELNVEVEAGCTFSKLAFELKQKNLTIGPPGPFSAFAATLGGGLAVNTYSIYGSNLYGLPSEKLLSLEVVLPTGQIINTGSAANPKSKPIFRYCNGPDFGGLFLGAHGTLGIITKATFRVEKRHQEEAYFDPVFDTIEECTQCAIELTKTRYTGMIMQFAPIFYKQSGLDIRAKGGGLLVNVFGDPENILHRKNIVENIITKYTDMTTDTFAPIFNAREYAKYRHWCCVNGKWAEIAGYLSLDKVNEYIKICENYIEKNKEIVNKTSLIPQMGAIYTLNCVNIFAMFLIYDVNPENTEASLTLTKNFADILFDFGLSPYWIGKAYSNAIFSRLDSNYVKLYHMIKNLLDPNAIMNPGMFELEKEGEP
ncbi:MAG: FAD-binding oxidoreductase [Candidatus Thorarchaeota archaeon]